MKRSQSGFTLVEIAIVLVIVGLILGGVLKGQEMIANAKVRNVIDQTTAIQTAIFAFQDRFRALPGDYSQAVANINGVTCPNGNGNGIVSGNPEYGCFWQHLGAAGFITGNYDGVATANNLTCNSSTCPINAFGAPIKYTWGRNGSGTVTNSQQLRIGRSIPVDVLAEIDRKIDDGAPDAGTFRADTQSNLGTCQTGAAPASSYNIAGGQQNCGGVRIN